MTHTSYEAKSGSPLPDTRQVPSCKLNSCLSAAVGQAWKNLIDNPGWFGRKLSGMKPKVIKDMP